MARSRYTYSSVFFTLISSLFAASFIDAQELPTFSFATALHSPPYTIAGGLCLDEDGNSYLVGFTRSNIFEDSDWVFPIGEEVDFPESTIYIAKVSPLGEILWIHYAGGPDGQDEALDIAYDASGYLFVTGYYGGHGDFDPSLGEYYIGHGSLGLGKDAFVMKLDLDGNLVWFQGMGGPIQDEGKEIEVDSNGDAYVLGSFDLYASFDLYSEDYYVNTIGQVDLFLEKFNSDGTIAWLRTLGGIGNEQARGMTIDSQNRVIIAGNYADSCDLDPGTDEFYLDPAGSNDSFLSVFDSDGNFLWARSLGGRTTGSLTTDENDNIIVTGCYRSNSDFDPGPDVVNVPAQENDFFIAKFDSEGNQLWYRTAGGEESDDDIIGVATDAINNIYVAGAFEYSVDFDFGPGIDSHESDLSSNGSSNTADAFVQKISPSGEHQWVIPIDGRGPNYASDIFINEEGSIFFTVSSLDTADYNPGPDVFEVIHDGIGPDPVIVKYDQPFGLNVKEVNDKIIGLYPNPAKNSVELLVPHHFENGQGQIFNTFGSLVCTFSFGPSQKHLDTSGLHPGVYQVVIRNTDNLSVAKLLIE